MTTYRIKHSPFFSPGTVIVLIGLAVLLSFHWLLGLLVILGGLVVDLAIGTRYLCGSCGNRLERTSALCPVCQARITGTRGSGFLKAVLIALLTISAAVIGLITWGRATGKHAPPAIEQRPGSH